MRRVTDTSSQVITACLTYHARSANAMRRQQTPAKQSYLALLVRQILETVTACNRELASPRHDPRARMISQTRTQR